MLDGAAQSAGDFRAVGVIVGEHGLQGSLKVLPLSDFPDRFNALRKVYLRRGEEIVGEDEVKRVRWAQSHLLVALHSVRTREDAVGLRGVELCVADADSWPLPKDVYYISDLIGFHGVSGSEVIGTLVGTQSGAQDILEFDGPHGNLLVPFVSEWVGNVDERARTIELLNWRRLIDSETLPADPADE